MSHEREQKLIDLMVGDGVALNSIEHPSNDTDDPASEISPDALIELEAEFTAEGIHMDGRLFRWGCGTLLRSI